jgi:acetoin utilization protein AcuB
MKVRDCMTLDPQTIAPHDTLAQAAEKMTQGGFRRLPVVDAEGKLIAMLTDRDLREHKGYWETTRVTAAMVEKPIVTNPDASLESAADVLLRRKIGGLPVVAEDGRPVGIITETDVIKGLLRQLRGQRASKETS